MPLECWIYLVSASVYMSVLFRYFLKRICQAFPIAMFLDCIHCVKQSYNYAFGEMVLLVICFLISV
ncbi:hypothetical protein BJV82DRAFT_606975, partial [Fennellomyces sp. T-0311]